jgi:hypothetical protein
VRLERRLATSAGVIRVVRSFSAVAAHRSNDEKVAIRFFKNVLSENGPYHMIAPSTPVVSDNFTLLNWYNNDGKLYLVAKDGR